MAILVWIGMFLFGVFVTYMALLWVMASFVRLYMKIDNLSHQGRKVPPPTEAPHTPDEVAGSCQS